MILAETVNAMLSNDYKERFKAEYHQLAYRLRNLKKLLKGWDDENLAFTPTCPRSVYDLQIKAMSEYKAILEARAVMEGINLQEV